MRLIDVEQVYCAECEARKLCDSGDVFCDIKSMPTVDAVPVVRCKDCVFYDPNTKVDVDRGYCLKYGFGNRLMKQMGDYCSYGERRKNHESL